MSEQKVNEFLAVCQKIKQAMLISHSGAGGLHGRPMFVAAVEDDGGLWFATDLDSTA